MVNFSFVIPHRNCPELLARCLNSIPEREDIEIIVVDDNSKDDLLPCIERKGVKTLRLTAEESKGAGHARNVGLREVTGKWVLFADADDTYTENLSQLLDDVCDVKEDVIYFNHAIISGNKVKDSACAFIPAKDDTGLFNLKYNITAPWNKIVRVEFLRRESILFEECPVGNDALFTYQVGYLANNRFRVINKDVYNYYINDGSIIHKKRNNDAYYLTICNHLFQRNALLRFLGRTEYTRSFIGRNMAVLLHKGIASSLQMIRVYLRHREEIKKKENYFVDVIKSTNREKDVLFYTK